jgi:hypothetical protein
MLDLFMTFATLLLIILLFCHKTHNLFSSSTLIDTFRFEAKSNKDEIFFKKTFLTKTGILSSVQCYSRRKLQGNRRTTCHNQVAGISLLLLKGIGGYL